MLTKKQQTKRNRLKPKAHKEPQYLKWLHEVRQPSCFVCNTFIGIQIHHIKEHSSDLRDDDKVIPLCYEHHLGNEFSVHGTARKFREEYPIEMQLEYAEELYNEYTEH